MVSKAVDAAAASARLRDGDYAPGAPERVSAAAAPPRRNAPRAGRGALFRGEDDDDEQEEPAATTPEVLLELSAEHNAAVTVDFARWQKIFYKDPHAAAAWLCGETGALLSAEHVP